MNQEEIVKNKFEELIKKVSSLEDLEKLRIQFLGKKSLFSELFLQLRTLNLENKKIVASRLNKIKEEINSSILDKKQKLALDAINQKLNSQYVDLTQPTRKKYNGLIHPISKVIKELKEIFSNLGFVIIDGPDIEDDFHNFSALNMEKNHPARQMQDTFYLNNHDKLLRTHTSSVQIRQMRNTNPPFKFVSIGKVYRKDYDTTHTPMFHQIEALFIDHNVSMGNLKWTIEEFLKSFFETKNLSTRFRPSFFPFTEPSAEVDIGFHKKNDIIKIGGKENFLEILGCGMVHPNVLKKSNIDHNKYQGFAFGIGIERLAMLKYGINDLRMLFNNDLRFLKHYGFKVIDYL